jgi:hypothetical protein
MPAERTAARLTTRERVVIIGFVLLNTVVPICIPDLFPFSSQPMFSAFPPTFSVMEVFSETGKPLPPQEFLLHSTELFNPNPRLGRRLPESKVPVGRLLTDDEVRADVAPVLAKRYPTVRTATVRQQLFAKNQKGLVEKLGEKTWQIENPSPER